MEDIPPELALNWDQTDLKIIPTSTWTMDREVEMVDINSYVLKDEVLLSWFSV